MAREIERGFLGLALALLVVAPGPLGAQERMGVLIPNLWPEGGASKKFGETTARELRTLFESMPTHRSIALRDMEQGMRRFKVDEDSLNCDHARSLASQMEVPLALCAAYKDVPGSIEVTAEFFDVRSGESFKVNPTNVAKDGGEKTAAEHIYNEFDKYTQQLRSTAICADYVNSKVWDQALNSCTRAVDLNPQAVGARFNRARVYFETEKFSEALGDLRALLQVNPRHEAALQMAGYVASQLGQDEEASGYFRQYLEVVPEDAGARARVAYELAQKGDPRGAMLLIQDGLKQDSTNIDLWEQLGGYAFSTGVQINEEAGNVQDASIAPEAVPYFHTAIDAYTRVFEAKGNETPAGHLRNIMAAYLSLQEVDNAIAMGARATTSHPQEAALWSTYADALQRAGRVDDALAALDRAAQIDPKYPNVGLRRGQWLLISDRLSDAATVFKSVVAADPTQADAVGRMVVSHAYATAIQPKRWAAALSVLSTVSGITGISADVMHQINFWQGYSVLQAAMIEQEPRTLETARATLPKFQRAKEMLTAANVGDYPASVGVNMGELRAAIDQFIEIQERIILRR